MSTFHSTVSRRDFMKMMALTGTAIGGAALVAPVFHDVDELMAAPTALQKRPWYVKEREFYNPTTEVDWDVMKRRNPDNTGQQTEMWAKYYGQAAQGLQDPRDGPPQPPGLEADRLEPGPRSLEVPQFRHAVGDQ